LRDIVLHLPNTPAYAAGVRCSDIGTAFHAKIWQQLFTAKTPVTALPDRGFGLLKQHLLLQIISSAACYL